MCLSLENTHTHTPLFLYQRAFTAPSCVWITCLVLRLRCSWEGGREWFSLRRCEDGAHPGSDGFLKREQDKSQNTFSLVYFGQFTFEPCRESLQKLQQLHGVFF